MAATLDTIHADLQAILAAVAGPVEYKIVKIGNQLTQKVNDNFTVMGLGRWRLVGTIGPPGSEQAVFMRPVP